MKTRLNLKNIEKNLEKLPKIRLYCLYLITFIFFMILGLTIGYGISNNTIYQLKKYEKRIEKETMERVNQKVENFQNQAK